MKRLDRSLDPPCCRKCGSSRVWVNAFLNGTKTTKAECRECRRVLQGRMRKRFGGAAARNKRWEANNQEKARAHKAVEYAVKVGKLPRCPCERCGNPRSHAHHDDYSKPLDVMWLCATHHRERHREIDRLGEGFFGHQTPRQIARAA